MDTAGDDELPCRMLVVSEIVVVMSAVFENVSAMSCYRDNFIINMQIIHPIHQAFFLP